MRYASVCDGIGAVHVAWQPLGWTCEWVAEIDPFPSAVVDQRWGFINRGDITRFREWEDGSTIDLLVGGTPCQSFSVAGLRRGLEDPRGGLMLTFIQIAQRYRPKWIIWENVPGVLSSNGGRDFGSLLGALAELGYGWAYRVLDSRGFGVPQRRRRVFVVACLGDQWRAEQVLFEPEREGQLTEKDAGSWQDAAAAVGGRAGGRGPLTAWQPCADCENDWCNIHSLHARDCGCVDVDNWAQDPAETPICEAVGFNWQNGGGYGKANEGLGITVDAVGPLQRCNVPAVAVLIRDFDTARGTILGSNAFARRITPREAERLQGFPDDYTAITYRKKPAADGPRYRALGNSMAVPCMVWLGHRIQQATKGDNK